MEADERVRWLERKIHSTLLPSGEDFSSMLADHDCRLAVQEFLNKETVRQLFVYKREDNSLASSLTPAAQMPQKSICFLKCSSDCLLMPHNMSIEVACVVCSRYPCQTLQVTLPEVYLPLLALNRNNTAASSGATSGPATGDKMLDLLESLVTTVKASLGCMEVATVLNLPPIEVLVQLTVNSQCLQSIYLHVLETTVIGWIKQMKSALQSKPFVALMPENGQQAGIQDEIHAWQMYVSNLQYIQNQLDSPVAHDILVGLHTSKSQYALTLKRVRHEIVQADSDARDVLKYLSTFKPCLSKLKLAGNTHDVVKVLKLLMHLVHLVWKHSGYFHQPQRFSHLLQLVSHEVVHKARSLVGEIVWEDQSETVLRLKQGLALCATFRSTYLLLKDVAHEENVRKISRHEEKVAAQSQARLFPDIASGPYVYCPPKSAQPKKKSTSAAASLSDRENNLNYSPWPAGNAGCLTSLNRFMDRCNDILDLIQICQNCQLLAEIVEGGGVFCSSADSQLEELHWKYAAARQEFFSHVQDALDIYSENSFDTAYFNLRQEGKVIEQELAVLLKSGFQESPSLLSQLRLLEVFEGIVGRDQIQIYLKSSGLAVVSSFTQEVQTVKEMFFKQGVSPPHHINIPKTVSTLLWVHGLKERLRIPWEKITRLLPHYLNGDDGQQARDLFQEAMQELQSLETEVIKKWEVTAVPGVVLQLRKPLLMADNYSEDVEVRPAAIRVNQSSQLLLLLKETVLLRQPPFSLTLPKHVEELLREVETGRLSLMAARLEQVVSCYNSMMSSMTELQYLMLEQKLVQIDTIVEQGLEHFTWNMPESLDFIEVAVSTVCQDAHLTWLTLSINCQYIIEMVTSWTAIGESLPSPVEMTKTFTIENLIGLYQKLNGQLEQVLVPHGHRIHQLMDKSLDIVQLSRASPQWKTYQDSVDAIVLDGLVKTVLRDIKSLSSFLVLETDKGPVTPLLTVKLQVTEDELTFEPPLHESSSNSSLQAHFQKVLASFLSRGRLVQMLQPEGSYEDLLAANKEVQILLSQIKQSVEVSCVMCQEQLLAIFKEFEYLWQVNFKQKLQSFLAGHTSCFTPRKDEVGPDSKLPDSVPAGGELIPNVSILATIENPVKSYCDSEDLFGMTPRSDTHISGIPTLDEFDRVMSSYETAQDRILSLKDYFDHRWIRVDVRPAKYYLAGRATSFISTFAEFLADKVTAILVSIDLFMKQINPVMESMIDQVINITSLTKILGLFNQVAAQQSHIEDQLSFTQKVVLLLHQYDKIWILPDSVLQLLASTLAQWNSWKAMMLLARQRLGPKIQQEAEETIKTLETFGASLDALTKHLARSQLYHRDCGVDAADETLQYFTNRLHSLEKEAETLSELQKLLEICFVDFSLLPVYQEELQNLVLVWFLVRKFKDSQERWLKQSWLTVATEALKEEINTQLNVLSKLPEAVRSWDVYAGLHDSVTTLQACLPLVENLNSSAMRTTHWKQLVQVTGVQAPSESDTFQTMSLAQLLSLDLKNHMEHVRAIIQKAQKEAEIEKTLRTSEEFWLMKAFELRVYSRNKHATSVDFKQDPDRVSLLTNTDCVFEDLEHQSIQFQVIQSNPVNGSYLVEVLQWQKHLQTIEVVLGLWLQVQSHWLDMEKFFLEINVYLGLPNDAKIFEAASKDFCCLMDATRKNPNILQCCSRKNIVKILENIKMRFETCRKSLLTYLDEKRDVFPRFCFLSIEDLFHIQCYSHNPRALSLHLYKLFENVGQLTYEPDKEDGHYVITGVRSVLDQKLHFIQALSCEVPAEILMFNLLNQLRATLQLRLAECLDKHQPVKLRSKSVHSVGARTVSIPMAGADLAGMSSAGSSQATLVAPAYQLYSSSDQDLIGLENIMTGGKQNMKESHAWILDHVTEVVLLTTSIQMTKQASLALTEFNNGNSLCLKEMLRSLKESSEAYVSLLQLLEHQMHTEIACFRNITSFFHDTKKKQGSPSQTKPEQDAPTHSIESTTQKSSELAACQQLSSLPAQVHKLRLMILLLSHWRDLTQRLISISQHMSPVNSFVWMSQLQYHHNEVSKTTTVTCMDATFDYGFEYLGSAKREIITPLTEKAFLLITQAVQTHAGIVCTRSIESSQDGIIQELAKCLGYPLYTFHSSGTTQSVQIHNVIKGMAMSGCWVLFTSMSQLPQSCLSLLSQLVLVIMNAFKTGQSQVSLRSQVMQLSHQGSCFGQLHPCATKIGLNPRDVLPSPVSDLQVPPEVLRQLRVVSLAEPDLWLYLSTLFLNQGFLHGEELARKLCKLFEFWRNIFRADVHGSQGSTTGSAINVACLHTCSIVTATALVRLAQSILVKTQLEHTTPAVSEDHTHVETRTYTQEEDAIIAAVWAYFSPRISSTDNDNGAAILASILGSLWPHHVQSNKIHDDEDLATCIVEAAADLRLEWDSALQDRVRGLSQLMAAHQAILVVGSAECGKSECIKTLALAERKRGREVKVEKVFIRAVESSELCGHFDSTGEWTDGLLTSVLRRLCVMSCQKPSDQRCLAILQLDGQYDSHHMDLLQALMNYQGLVMMPNYDRVRVPDHFRLIWELENLEQVSPSMVATSGVVWLSPSDLTWGMLVSGWLKQRPETDRTLLTELCSCYLDRIVGYFKQTTDNLTGNGEELNEGQNKRVISHGLINMITTFTRLLEALISTGKDLSSAHLEKCFLYSAVWAFAGTLIQESRKEFSSWWRKEFQQYRTFPSNGTIFDYTVNNETGDFSQLSVPTPTFMGSPYKDIPSNLFLHTVRTQQLLHLLDLLVTSGKSVLLVGESACGKTAIAKEWIQATCSGVGAEVVSLKLSSNRCTNSQQLYQRLDKMLQWKQGPVFVPCGNKKLVYFVDDINFSQTDKHGCQTMCGLIRQHLDDGGFYSLANHSWRCVKGVTYLATLNPVARASATLPSPRLLRHFTIFGCPVPEAAELETIFSWLLTSHFSTLPETSNVEQHGAGGQRTGTPSDSSSDGSVQTLILPMVKATVELFERLGLMFLATPQRCHYFFTFRELAVIFRNMCLSLGPGCSRETLFRLWQHECLWLCGQRMSNHVDHGRFQELFQTMIHKHFIDDVEIGPILKHPPPLFSNFAFIEDTTEPSGEHNTRNDGVLDIRTSCQYLPVISNAALLELMHKALEKYCKAQPFFHLPLNQSVVEQVCRLSHVMSFSPGSEAATVLVAESCPAMCSSIVQFSAALSGFKVLPVSANVESVCEQLDSFKADLTSACLRAGLKKEKLVLLIEEKSKFDYDCLALLAELLTSGDITHIFTQKEQTTIINSIRRELTQEMRTMTQTFAWSHFHRAVLNNLKVILILRTHETNLQTLCWECPSLAVNVNYMWIQHWTKAELIEHARWHFKKKLDWMNDLEQDNLAYLLASIHEILRQQDAVKSNGSYGHLNNSSYQHLVERFIFLVHEHHSHVQMTHKTVTKVLSWFRRESEETTKLGEQLKEELVVLEEHGSKSASMLSQIGQDLCASELNELLINKQLKELAHLKQLLSECQTEHEQAVFEVIQLVANTKKVVKLLDTADLDRLRAIQSPTPEVEELMALIIMLLKSETADLTWQKGAKQQLASLDKFVEELISFDDIQLPESALALVEARLKTSSFDPDLLEKTVGNSACGALCRWILGVTRFHRMMYYTVKPCHKKLDAVIEAANFCEQTMKGLEAKKKRLDNQLSELYQNLENTTMYKNRLQVKTDKMKATLATAAQVQQVFGKESPRYQQIYDSLQDRLVSIPGSCALAAAMSTYLGPYHHSFRRAMLTTHWPKCLRECGVPIIVDSIDSVRGRVVEMSFPPSASETLDSLGYFSGASLSHRNSYQVPEEEVQQQAQNTAFLKMENTQTGNEPTAVEEIILSVRQTAEKSRDSVKQTCGARAVAQEDNVKEQEDTKKVVQEAQDLLKLDRLEYPPDTNVALSSSEYFQYVKSLVKILVGDDTLNEWLTQDLGLRMLENMAILRSSSRKQTTLLIDPSGEGCCLLEYLHNSTSQSPLVVLDMSTRLNPQSQSSLEDAASKGRSLLIKNCSVPFDRMIDSLIHLNFGGESYLPDFNTVTSNGQRIVLHPQFRLYLASSLTEPQMLPCISSKLYIINFDSSHEMLSEDLLIRAFACIRPRLHKERQLALRNLKLQKTALLLFSEKINEQVLSPAKEVMLSSPSVLQCIDNIIKGKTLLHQEMCSTQALLDDLVLLRDELYPLARHASLMFSLIQSLTALGPAYQFSLVYFLTLFDEAMATVAGTSPISVNHLPQEGLEKAESIKKNKGTQKYMKSTSNLLKSNENEICAALIKDPVFSFATCGDNHNLKEATSAISQVCELPQMASLPSEGLEFTSYPTGQVQLLVDHLTRQIYGKISLSLLEPHRFLFSTLLVLCMNQDADQMTSEEMSFFLQGNPGLKMELTLADFNCAASPPQWLPCDKFQDILALSLLPGPLDGICVDVARYTHQWQEWYESTCPELQQFPAESRVGSILQAGIEENSQTADISENNGPQGEEFLQDFHRMLLLRVLRPDRLLPALIHYVQKHCQVPEPSQNVFPVSQLLAASRGYWAVLILLPAAACDLAPAHQVSQSPGELLFNLANVMKLPVTRISTECEDSQSIDTAVRIAEQKGGWAIIDCIHLASPAVISKLSQLLSQIQERADRQKEGRRGRRAFCVWLTAERFDNMPSFMIQNLLKVAWNSKTWIHGQEASQELHQEISNKEPVFSRLLPESNLKSSIISSLQLIPTQILQSLSGSSPMTQKLVYAAVVIHSLLVSQQQQLLGGGDGVDHLWGVSQLLMAVEAVNLPMFLSLDHLGSNLEVLSSLFSDVIYSSPDQTEADRTYIKELCSHIFGSLAEKSLLYISLGRTLIPIPDSTVAPENYADWFAKAVKRNISMSLNASLEKLVNIQSSNKILQKLNQMKQVYDREAGDLSPAINKCQFDLDKLRLALDFTLDHLPSFLNKEFNSSSGKLLSEIHDGQPDHPSETACRQVPDLVRIVLKQECLQMSLFLASLKQEVADLKNHLMGGTTALPRKLIPTAQSLQLEEVPTSWIHPIWLPSFRTLVTWLENLNQRCDQLNSWIEQGLVPGYPLPDHTSRGELRKVWLGGLINPGAFLWAALCGGAHGQTNMIKEVCFECRVMNSDGNETELDSGGFLLTDLTLENAGWDKEANRLKDMGETGSTHIKSMYLKPRVVAVNETLLENKVIQETVSPDTGNKEMSVCNLPLYTNQGRKVQVCSLLVNCPQPATKWTLARTAFILDPGVQDHKTTSSRLQKRSSWHS